MGDFFLFFFLSAAAPAALPLSAAYFLLLSPSDAAKTFLSPPAGGFCLLIFDAVLCLVFFPFSSFFPPPTVSLLPSFPFWLLFQPPRTLCHSFLFLFLRNNRSSVSPLCHFAARRSRRPLICAPESRPSGELCCRTAASPPRLPASCPGSCGSMPATARARTHTHTHTIAHMHVDTHPRVVFASRVLVDPSVAGGGRAAGFRASGGCGAREVEDRQRE